MEESLVRWMFKQTLGKQPCILLEQLMLKLNQNYDMSA